MKIFKLSVLIIFLLINIFLYSNNDITFDFKKNTDYVNLTSNMNNTTFNYKSYLEDANIYSFFKKSDYYYDVEKYKYEKKEELLLRRSEILFFGSLTFVTFGGWFFISIFNTLIYNDQFGKIRREQFLPLFLGSGTISIAVVFSDLFINIKPKLEKNNIEIY